MRRVGMKDRPFRPSGVEFGLKPEPKGPGWENGWPGGPEDNCIRRV